MRRLMSLGGGVAAAAAIAGMALGGGATAASPLPTMNFALRGASGVKVSGQEVSGAVNIRVTFSGSLPRNNNGGPSMAIARLNPGTTIQEAFRAVGAAHGDINAVTSYAKILVDAGPGLTQAVLPAGNYVALNVTGSGNPGVMPFTITQSSHPATLPPAQATIRTIEFGFRGPAILHQGTILREVNSGWLVHMDQFIGAGSKANALEAMKLLAEGRDNQAGRFFTHDFFGSGVVTHGGRQQQLVTAKPGYYVEACFMDTQDGREHTRLGMVRLVQVVK